MAFIHPAISLVLYGTVSAIWLIPDKRIEKNVAMDSENSENEEI